MKKITNNVLRSFPRKTAGKIGRSVMLAFALLVAMTLQAVSAQGQEMIRSIHGSATDFTLARIVNPYQQWIVYNENAIMSLFGRMDTSGLVNTFVRTQLQIHVKDMEISGGSLYFCGNMFDNEVMSEVGVMGFFSISQLSSPSTMSINYILFKEFKELRKLAFYATAQTKHVAMVGTGMDDRDYIVDAYYGGIDPDPSGFQWERAWMYMPNIDARFDDIACIKDSVVVSSRVENETEVQICFIQKTGLEGCAFFSPASHLDVVKVPDQPIGRVLLQKAKGVDEAYAFYRYGPYLDVCQFIGKNNPISFHIPILHVNGYFPEYFTLKDVCIDKDRKDEISVLLTKVYSQSPYHRIYHIPTTLFPSISNVLGHEYGPYSSYTPMSLCGGKDYHTVSMGRFLEDWGMARVVNSQYEYCSEQLNTKTTMKKTAVPLSPKEYNVIAKETEVLHMAVSVQEYPVYYECSDYARENNTNQ